MPASVTKVHAPMRKPQDPLRFKTRRSAKRAHSNLISVIRRHVATGIDVYSLQSLIVELKSIRKEVRFHHRLYMRDLGDVSSFREEDEEDWMQGVNNRHVATLTAAQLYIEKQQYGDQASSDPLIKQSSKLSTHQFQSSSLFYCKEERSLLDEGATISSFGLQSFYAHYQENQSLFDLESTSTHSNVDTSFTFESNHNFNSTLIWTHPGWSTMSILEPDNPSSSSNDTRHERSSHSLETEVSEERIVILSSFETKPTTADSIIDYLNLHEGMDPSTIVASTYDASHSTNCNELEDPAIYVSTETIHQVTKVNSLYAVPSTKETHQIFCNPSDLLPGTPAAKWSTAQKDPTALFSLFDSRYFTGDYRHTCTIICNFPTEMQMIRPGTVLSTSFAIRLIYLLSPKWKIPPVPPDQTSNSVGPSQTGSPALLLINRKAKENSVST